MKDVISINPTSGGKQVPVSEEPSIARGYTLPKWCKTDNHDTHSARLLPIQIEGGLKCIAYNPSGRNGNPIEAGWKFF